MVLCHIQRLLSAYCFQVVVLGVGRGEAPKMAHLWILF